MKNGTLDTFERTVRAVLGVTLILVCWDYGLTVIGTGALILGLAALATALAGRSPADRYLARFDQS
jgi:hypothetical protein